MCVFCNGFRNRIRGYEELDNKLFRDSEVRLGVEKERSEVYLVVLIDGKLAVASPMAYCPMCGGKIE